MNTLDFIYNRKSVRRFTEEDIPKEIVLEILQAGTYAPSPKHQQNWHFVVLKNREVIQELAEIVDESHEKIGQLATNEKDYKRHMSVQKYYTCFKAAPVVILVYSEPYKMIEHKILEAAGAPKDVLEKLLAPRSEIQAIGAAIENMLLATEALGYSGCYMTGPTHAKPCIEEAIDFHKEGYELYAMVALGRQAGEVVQPPRRPLEEVVTFIE